MPTNAQVLKVYEQEKSAVSLMKNLCVDFLDAEFHIYDKFDFIHLDSKAKQQMQVDEKNIK
jgi:hypothetical protein